MDQFERVTDDFLACLWDEKVAAEAAANPAGFKRFTELVTRAKNHAAARKASSESFSEFLPKPDEQKATLLLNYITKSKEGEGKTSREKRAFLQRLDGQTAGILAVLLSGDELVKLAKPTLEAHVEGARKIAEWSSWSNTTTVASEAVLPSPSPQPIELARNGPTCTAQWNRVQPPRWVLRCSSCNTNVDLRCASCEQATGKPP